MASPHMARRDPVSTRLARVKGFVLDMDGTLVLGDSRNPGLSTTSRDTPGRAPSSRSSRSTGCTSGV